MIEKYYLNGDELPNILTPHDCQVKEIYLKDEYLVFELGDDLFEYDSIEYVYPNALSLVIRYHLIDDVSVVIENKNGYKNIELNKMLKKHKFMEYLYHYVRYDSMIIELFNGKSIIFKLYCDYVEYEWKLEE